MKQLPQPLDDAVAHVEMFGGQVMLPEPYQSSSTIARLATQLAAAKDECERLRAKLDREAAHGVDMTNVELRRMIAARQFWKDACEARDKEREADRAAMAGWKGLATYYAESLKQAAAMCGKLESLTDGTPDDENFARVVAEVNEALHQLSNHVCGTDIGAHLDYGAWMTKDGWSDEPPMGDVGEPKMRLLTLAALAARLEPSDEQISADLKAAGIDMTEPNKRLREMVNKAKENQ